MPICDLCGREGELLRAEVEGSELSVCSGCSRYGRVLGKVRKEAPKPVLPKKVVAEEEIEERVVSDFAWRLRRAREKRRMKQEEFSKLLNEKESLVQKWEGGGLKPQISVAKKLGQILKENFVEKTGVKEEEKLNQQGGKGGEATLGDLVKVRKRK